MKKTRVIIMILLLTLLLAACNSADESTRMFEMDQDGVKSTIEYTFQGDKVKTQTTKNTLTYSLAGIDSKEEAIIMFSQSIPEFENIDGISHSVDYGDTQAVENLMIDFEKIDPEEISEIPGMIFEGDFEKGVSMEKSAKLLESYGFKEIE